MTDSSNNKARRPQQQQQQPQHPAQQPQQVQQHQLRRTKMKASQRTCATHEIRNTRAEFKRLKTILPSIRRKENVSKLDIILEAIKYIDDLQDQLFDRLTGSQSQRKATLMALTEQDMERSRARLLSAEVVGDAADVEDLMVSDDDEHDQEGNVSEEVLEEETTTSDEDNHSHASLELWKWQFPFDEVELALLYCVCFLYKQEISMKKSFQNTPLLQQPWPPPHPQS